MRSKTAIIPRNPIGVIAQLYAIRVDQVIRRHPQRPFSRSRRLRAQNTVHQDVEAHLSEQALQHTDCIASKITNDFGHNHANWVREQCQSPNVVLK